MARPSPRHPPRRATRGFSLVEMMVAMAAGLIVAMAITVFVVNMLRSHNENVLATRLMQELRTSQAFVSREIRRAGFNRDALAIIANPEGYNDAFASLTLADPVEVAADDCPGLVATGVAEANQCMVFAYDRVGVNDAATAPDGLEWKGVRRVVGEDGTGRLQAFLGTSAAATPSCDDDADDADWADLTAPGQDITRLLLASRVSDDIEVGTIPGATLTIRQVFVQIDGQVPDSGIRRRICDDIRVRADRLSFPAPPAPPTP